MKRAYINPLAAVLAIVLLFGTLVAPVYAGKLDDFENAVTKKPDEKKEERRNQKQKSKEKDSEAGESDDYYTRVFAELFLMAVIRGAEASSERMSPPGTVYGVTPRVVGEPVLPYVRLDANYFYSDKNLSAFDTRVEAGYSFIGADYRETVFFERNPSDRMTLERYHLLVRMTVGERSGVDLGFGGVGIDGNFRSSGYSVTTPVNIHPTEHIGLSFRPVFSWINTTPITDYDFSAAYNAGFFSVRAGYRWVGVGRTMIKGPYAGLSLHY